MDESTKPEIVNHIQAISRKKDNGTEVDYFLFDTFEIHTNLIPSECIQDWHVHHKIEEIIVVNEGSLFLEWLEEKILSRKVVAGEIIRMKNSIHRISNLTGLKATCTIFRFVSSFENQAKVIQQDKTSFTEEEIEHLIQKRKE